MDVIIAPRAKRDIANILAWSLENFGPQTAKRYARLIETAIATVAADTQCAGGEAREEIAENCRTYHLFHVRRKAGGRGNRIRSPRHFLLYKATEDDTLEIGRVLHDSVDFDRHIPEDYRTSVE